MEQQKLEKHAIPVVFFFFFFFFLLLFSIELRHCLQLLDNELTWLNKLLIACVYRYQDC